MVELMVLLN